jgi:hypothetical protein
MLRLFDMLVRPIATYGCPVWAPGLMCFDTATGGFNGFDQTTFSFLRFVSGCSTSTHRWILLHEHSMVPMQAHWLRHTVRWWRTMAGKPDWLAHKALKESISMSLGGGAGRVMWFSRFAECMSKVGLQFDSSSVDTVLATHFQDKAVEDALHALHDRVWQQFRGADPRATAGPGSTLCRYENWVYDGSFGMHVPHPERGTRTFGAHTQSASIAPSRYRALARFRAGCWPIAVNAGRYEGVERNDRICQHCNELGVWGCIEDEKHVLLECPRFADLRARFSSLFADDCNMKAVLNHSDQPLLAELLYLMHQVRFRDA